MEIEKEKVQMNKRFYDVSHGDTNRWWNANDFSVTLKYRYVQSCDSAPENPGGRITALITSSYYSTF